MECWDGLLLLLSQLPLLRQLCLDHILPLATLEDSFINTQNTTKVSLSQLEKLTLTDPICWVMALLAQLVFPRSMIVRVKCNCDNPEDISMFLPFMADRFSSHLSLPQSTPSPQSALWSLGFDRSNPLDTTWTVTCGTSNPANTNKTNNVSLEELEEQLYSQFPLQIILTRMGQEASLGRIIPLLCALPMVHLNAITLYSDIDVEAIPIYVEELLLLLTCCVEGTSWDDSGSWSRAIVLYKRWTLFIYYKHCDAWLWRMTCDM